MRNDCKIIVYRNFSNEYGWLKRVACRILSHFKLQMQIGVHVNILIIFVWKWKVENKPDVWRFILTKCILQHCFCNFYTLGLADIRTISLGLTQKHDARKAIFFGLFDSSRLLSYMSHHCKLILIDVYILSKVYSFSFIFPMMQMQIR